MNVVIISMQGHVHGRIVLPVVSSSGRRSWDLGSSAAVCLADYDLGHRSYRRAARPVHAVPYGSLVRLGWVDSSSVTDLADRIALEV